MNELNLIINEIITQEKNQLDLKTLRLMKKFKYFVVRRLMIFQNLVNKKKILQKNFKAKFAS